MRHLRLSEFEMAFGMGLKICSSDGVQLMLSVGQIHLQIAVQTVLVGKLLLKNVNISLYERLGCARRQESVV